MKQISIKFSRNFWIYTLCTISAIIILFGLNWILRLPKIIDIIGDENTWLPIVADAVISGIIFIAGNWYANADRIRNDISQKTNDFLLISNSVNRVINSLNISRKQLAILYSIEISMDSPALIKEVLMIQQEIDEARQQFEQIKYLINDTSAVTEFEDCIDTVSKAYHSVFDGLQEILNKWISVNSSSTEAKTVADYVGSNSDKANYAIQYVEHCKKLQSDKAKFLKIYNSQRERVELLFSSIKMRGKSILDGEHKIIINLENKL